MSQLTYLTIKTQMVQDSYLKQIDCKKLIKNIERADSLHATILGFFGKIKNLYSIVQQKPTRKSQIRIIA